MHQQIGNLLAKWLCNGYVEHHQFCDSSILISEDKTAHVLMTYPPRSPPGPCTPCHGGSEATTARLPSATRNLPGIYILSQDELHPKITGDQFCALISGVCETGARAACCPLRLRQAVICGSARGCASLLFKSSLGASANGFHRKPTASAVAFEDCCFRLW